MQHAKLALASCRKLETEEAKDGGIEEDGKTEREEEKENEVTAWETKSERVEESKRSF